MGNGERERQKVCERVRVRGRQTEGGGREGKSGNERRGEKEREMARERGT